MIDHEVIDRGRPDAVTRSIRLSAWEVRAILGGQTALLLRPVVPQAVEVLGGWPSGEGSEDWIARELAPFSPYATGDRLWVRETWGLTRDGGGDWLWYAAGGPPMRINHGDGPRCDFVDDGKRRRHPSIHMPRWASRLTLQVEAVRVGRLQQIGEADALAWGVTKALVRVGAFPYDFRYGAPGEKCACADGTIAKGVEHHPTPQAACAVLWNGVYGKRTPWASNPFAWLIGVRRVTP